MTALLFFFALNLYAQTEKIILTTGKNPGSGAYKYLEMVYTEAFSRIGISLEITSNTLSRSSKLSDAGEVDGELSRINDYGLAHPALVRVEVPHWAVRIVAISTDPTLVLMSWESLSHSDYTICYQRGAKLCEDNLAPIIKENNLIPLDFGNYGLDMLLSGRADIFVISEINAMEMLSEETYADSDLHIAGLMETYTSHAFIHGKHGDLADRLSPVLEEMKEEGLLLQYKISTGIFIYEDFFQ